MYNILFIAVSGFIVYFAGCRYVSAYFESAFIKKHIKIKSEILANLFIAGGYGRSPRTNPEDRNKMSFVGVISYIYFLLSFIPYALYPIFQENKCLTNLVVSIFWLNLPLALLGMILNNISLFLNENIENDSKAMKNVGRYVNAIGMTIFSIILLVVVGGLIITIYKNIKNLLC